MLSPFPAAAVDMVAATGLPAIGVLLPLSGQYKSFGEPCLRGIQLALGTVGTQTPMLRVVVLDTKGDRAEAASAYQRLASDPGVMAVLGPMLAWELEAMEPYVAGIGLPSVSFSQRLVTAGGTALRFSMTKEDQAHVLARYAVNDRGLRRWAVLRPDDPYGREMAGFFREEVEKLGGRVIADIAYESSKTDFQADVQRLHGRLGMVENEPPPIDGVFLPDSAERVVLVAPHLSFGDIRGIQLLGGSGWNQPEVLRKGMPYVNGAVFVDGFFLHSFVPEVRGFVDAYRDAYRTDPGALEAYGYDAANLVKEAILGGAADRRAVRDRIRQPGVRSGATGVTRILGDGRIEKELFLLKVEDGTVRELEAGEAPAEKMGTGPIFHDDQRVQFP